MSQDQWWFPLSRTFLNLAVWLLVPALSMLAGNAAAQSYRVVDMATLAPGSSVVVRGPNTAGLAVGGGRLVANGSTLPRVGLLFQSGAAAQQIVGFAGSDNTTVFGVNDAGSIVGSSNTATAVRAFIDTLAGAVRELPPLPGDTVSIAYAINNVGQAVGFSGGPAGDRAVIWNTNGTPAALAGTSNLPSSRAFGINELGGVAGVRGTGASRRAVFWPAGGAAQDLMLLAGHSISEAYAINARGDVVGYSANAAGTRRAALWPLAGPVVDIGTLPGGDFSQAFGINDAGDVVGASGSSAGDRAFLWTRASGIRDLNSLIPPSSFVLTKAAGINNLGMIVATGYDDPAGHTSDGHIHETHELPIRVFLLIRSGGSQ
jgi:probable HAF family extracellular repeat protein